MMPVYADFIKKHYGKFRDYFYLIPVADKELLPIINKHFDGEDLPIKIAEQSMKDFLSISSLSIVTSGTATLEASILESPPIICYKTNTFNYSIISRMLRIDNVGLPNLLLGKRQYIELIQNECNVENLIDAVKATEDLIPHSSEYASMIRELLKGNGYSEAIKAIEAL